MKFIKRVVILLLILIFGLNLLPQNILKNKSVQASTDINIISNTAITVTTAKKWAQNSGATDTFVSLADLYWNYASTNGNVNPAVAYAQAAKETGFGKFGGVIDESYHNPCGLKTSTGGSDTDPNAHQRFNSWEEGVQAHLDHLALYAGANGYPRSVTYDPRHFSSIKGTATTVVALGGKWAPSTTYGSEIMTLYSQMETLEVNLKPYSTIDTPNTDSTISGDVLTVAGWALNPSGIKEIKIYIDNNYMGSATYGIARPDVANVFPGYNNVSQCGFNAQINISSLTSGKKNLRVEEIGNDGTVNNFEKSINYNRIDNITCLDSPSENYVINGDSLKVSGWAINLKTISSVNVYIDGVLKGNVQYGSARPDVGSIFPNFSKSSTSGYCGKIDVRGVSDGNKVLKVVQVASDGTSASVERNITIKRVNSMTQIDYPSTNLKVNTDTLTVNGWAVNVNTINKINVYVDGVLKATTNTNIARPDVASIFETYSNAQTSGYSANVDLSGLSNGNKVIKVEQMGSDGVAYSCERTISLSIPQPITDIDGPAENGIIKNNSLNVSGWAINYKPVSKINIYIDGTLMKTTTTGVVRYDVANAFQEYYNAKTSGYNTNIDISGISDGNKVLKVEQVNTSGVVTSAQRNITVSRTKSRVTIDSPSDNYSIRGNKLQVNGWALDLKGVSKVNIYLDGNLMGQATYGIARPDVGNIFSEYGVVNSGYSGIIDVTNVTDGTKTLKVEEVANDGTTSSVSKNVVINNNKSEITIDSPSGSVNSNSFTVNGWAVNARDTSKINVYVDGVLLGTTTTGLSRPDVGNCFPNFSKASVSGFSCNVDATNLQEGNRVITVEHVTNDGSKTSVSKTILLLKFAPRAVIDSPSNNQSIRLGTSSVTVNGWSLNASGVKEVKVYLDGNYVTSAQIGISRPDVASLFPGYANSGSSGYTSTINTSGLSIGNHSVRIDSIGNDGTTATVTNTFKVDKNVLIVIDPGHNYGGDFGAISTFDGITYSETDLNMKVAVYLKSSLESMGYSVLLTRNSSDRDTSDVNTSLANRVNLANNNNADLYISIHQNSFTSQDAHGVEVYSTQTNPDSGYPSWNSNKLSVSSNLATSASNNISASTGFYNRGAKVQSLFVLRNTKMPAILVECGFISNQNEAISLATDLTEMKIASSIAQSVKSTIG